MRNSSDQSNAGISSQARLDSASARKLELEALVLEEHLTPTSRRRETLKVIAGASSLVLAFVTIAGGLLSVLSWLYQESRSRDLRVEERMDRSLSLLSETRPTQRVAAVSSLQSFVTNASDTRNAQVLVSVANALPLEENDTVRNAMISLLEDIDPQIAGKKALDSALKSLAYNSRGLVRESRLWDHYPRYGFYRIADTVKKGPALEATARAIGALLRKGARVKDLSEIYLPDSNLSGLDLVGTIFDFSILALTNFSNSILKNSSFIDANLDNASFVGSDLRAANFSDQRNRGYKKPFSTYVQLMLASSPPNIVFVTMPDFSCADLRNADFSNHPLFGIWHNDVPVNVEQARFSGSNLENAKLSDIALFVVMKPDENGFPIEGERKSGHRLGLDQYREESNKPLSEYMGYIFQPKPNAPLLKNRASFISSLKEIQNSLQESNWKQARLPFAISNLLADAAVPNQESTTSSRLGVPCTPRASWRTR